MSFLIATGRTSCKVESGPRPLVYLLILFATVHRKTDFLVNLYWDNRYSDFDSDSDSDAGLKSHRPRRRSLQQITDVAQLYFSAPQLSKSWSFLPAVSAVLFCSSASLINQSVNQPIIQSISTSILVGCKSWRYLSPRRVNRRCFVSPTNFSAD